MSKNLYFSAVVVWLIVPSFLSAQNRNNMNDTTKTLMPSDKNEVHTFSKNDGYTLMTDLSAFKERESVLFFDSTCTIIGLDYIPRALYCNPILDPSKLPEYIKKNFNDIRVVIFEVKLAEDSREKTFLSMPKWIMSMPNLEYLTLNGVMLHKSFFTEGLPVQHLVIEEMLSTDKKIIVSHISNLKNLQYLVHKDIFTPEEIADIGRKMSSLKILSDQEYDAKLDNGEIPLPDWSKKN